MHIFSPEHPWVNSHSIIVLHASHVIPREKPEHFRAKVKLGHPWRDPNKKVNSSRAILGSTAEVQEYCSRSDLHCVEARSRRDTSL